MVEQPRPSRGVKVFSDGDYVRLLMAPNTRLGTIEGSTGEKGQAKYLFRQDKRFDGGLNIADFYVVECEIAACKRPTDSEVEAINQSIRRGT
jgi:hypothetical protein